MIRVLHVLGALNPGGVESWLMNVLRHIDRSKFQLDFCTFGPEKGVFAAEAESLGSIVHSCPIQKGALSLGRRFRKIVREGKYDVVHSHVHHFSGAVLRWAHEEEVPMRIAHSHSSSDGKNTTPRRALYRYFMKRLIQKYATHKVAASGEAARYLFQPSTQFESTLLRCGVDLQAFQAKPDRSQVRAECGISSTALVVGHVGRFSPPKNHNFILDIATELVPEHPEVHFLLVGDGPLRPQMERRASELGLLENIHFLGTRFDTPRLMLGAMDVYLFPSTYEGMPLALIEAQAAGLPILVSNKVTQEAVVCDSLVTTHPLECGSSYWAKSLLRLLALPINSAVDYLDCVRNSPFSIESSLSALESIYLNSERL